MLIKEVSYLLQKEQYPYHTKISGGNFNNVFV